MAKKKTTSKPAATPPGSRKNRVKKKPAKPGAPGIEQAAQAHGIAHGPHDKSHGFAVVGIGASAGGLKALISFFEAMPADSGLAFVLVQHLDPTHQSLSAELIGRHTQMSVVEVQDAMQRRPQRRVCHPAEPLLDDRRSNVAPDRTARAPRPARADRFFLPLAGRRTSRNGRSASFSPAPAPTARWGSARSRRPAASSWFRLPKRAKFDGMPRSAIATGIVDSVLPVEKMPEVLIRYARHSYLKGDGAPATESEKSPDHLTTIVSMLRARQKYDFSCYKRSTLIRRMQRRMSLLHIDDMPGYIEYLRRNKDEAPALFKDMLISVTNFFRDPEAWESLTKRVIAPLVQDCDPHAPLRVWVPGCATGEEAYSIAMLLAEADRIGGQILRNPHFRLGYRPRGAAGGSRWASIPKTSRPTSRPGGLKQFFIKGDRTYRINKEIREDARLRRAEPHQRSPLLQARPDQLPQSADLPRCGHPEEDPLAVPICLAAGGYLLLGGSETISTQHDLFVPVSRKCRIFRRIGLARHEKLDLPALASDQPPRPKLRSKSPNRRTGGWP